MIGSSIGMAYQDEFHMEAAPWIKPPEDNNVIDPDILNPEDDTKGDNNHIDPSIKTPDFITDVAKKSDMPFPDNNNPDTDFNNRFPNLPKSGILNDIKPSDPVPPLMRKISDQWDTPMNAQEQADYNKKFSPQDSEDYDMQGWYKQHPDVDPHTDGTHYPDTFKKPSHPTFSDQSQYSTPDTQGGQWTTDEKGGDVFTPGPQNIKNGMDKTIEYLKWSDPNVKLNYDK